MIRGVHSLSMLLYMHNHIISVLLTTVLMLAGLCFFECLPYKLALNLSWGAG